MDNLTKYNSFICYRRGDEKDDVIRYSSRVFAKEIKKIIDNKLTTFKPVAFEEEISCNYFSDISKMMQSVKSFIICFCDGFFDKTISRYNDCGKNLEKFKSSANDSSNPDIIYLEVKNALNNSEINFFPFFVDYVDSDGKEFLAFEYITANLGVLNEIFEVEFEKYLYVTNVPKVRVFSSIREIKCEFNQKSIERYLNKKEISATRKEEFSSLARGLKRFYNPLTNEGNNSPCKTLDLSLNEIDYNAYKKISQRYDDIYHISNAYINGVERLKRDFSARTDYLKFCGQGFNDVANLCKIDNDVTRYAYWTLELNASSVDTLNVSKNNKISVCSLCFGILLLNSYLNTDKETFKDVLYNYSGFDEEEVRKKVQGALNLLMTLRDYQDFSWMSEWYFSDGVKNGTINQTTLSVATMISSGFLRFSSLPNSLSDKEKSDATFNRFLYVQGSAQWLKNALCVRGEGIAILQHIDGEPSCNISLTVFCAEVFLKYLREITILSEQISKEYKCVIDDERVEIKKRIVDILSFLSDYYDDRDSFKENDDRSICEFSKILSLCAQIVKNNDKYDNLFDAETVASCKTMIADIYKMICEIDDEKILSCVYVEKMQLISSSNEVGYDNYENCGHLIYITALLDYAYLVDDTSDDFEKLRVRIYNLITKFKERFASDGAVCCKNGNSRHYPIYALYYYRNVIADFYDKFL